MISREEFALGFVGPEIPHNDRCWLDFLGVGPMVRARRHDLPLFRGKHSKVGCLDLSWHWRFDSEPVQDCALYLCFYPFVLWQHLFQRSGNVAEKCFCCVMKQSL